jgi:peptidoglycan/LPS O-acetylase OafA/YrhL
LATNPFQSTIRRVVREKVRLDLALDPPSDCPDGGSRNLRTSQANPPRSEAATGRITRLTGVFSAYASVLLDKKPSTGDTLIELDGLRGFAVLVVIASHTNLLQMRGQGALGVWLFFVLSGFLLTRIMLQKLPGALTWKELARYFVRRVARILPLYYLVLSLATLYERREWSWLYRHLAFVRADGHFWSIPQEELFYLLLPLLTGTLYFLQRPLRLPRLLSAGLLMIAIVTGFPFFALNGNGKTVPFYINVFILGFFLAHLLDSSVARSVLASDRFAPIANVMGVVCLLLILFTADAHRSFFERFNIATVPLGWRFPTVSAILCSILLLTALKKGSWVHRLFSRRTPRILGVLSFGLYLVHPFVMSFLVGTLPLSEGLPLFAATLLTSTAVALLLERLVERPCMSLGRRINREWLG